MNKVLLIGRIANDVRTYTTPSGVPYSRTVLAVSRRTNSTTNEITDFIPLVGWREMSNILSNFTEKGSLIGIEGYFTTSQYKKEDQYIRNYEVTIERIDLLESRSQREKRQNNSNVSTNKPQKNYSKENEDNKFVDNEEETNDVTKKFSFDVDLD